jgi:carbon storage regulator
MLVLSRRPGEQLKIGEEIWVTLLEMRRGHVRIGIEAPKEIPIIREKLDPPDSEILQQPPAA